MKAGGSAIDRGSRPSPGFDLKEALLSGRVKFLTKTDFPEWGNKEVLRIRLTFIFPLAPIGR